MTIDQRVRLASVACWIQIVLWTILFGGHLTEAMATRQPGSIAMTLVGLAGLISAVLLRFGPGRFYAPDTVRARLESKDAGAAG